MKKNYKVGCLSEYIGVIQLLTDDLCKSPYVFRGQTDCRWPIESGALRRVKDTECSIETYHVKLLSGARKRSRSHPSIESMPDLQLIAELQHYGAATMLIDFTYNSLVALFFACDKYPNRDGVVFCYEWINAQFLSYDDEISSLHAIMAKLDKGDILWEPTYNNDRIVKQDSVFIINKKGMIDQANCTTIRIDKSVKSEIQLALKSFFHLSDESIYPDFIGFVRSNAHDVSLFDSRKYILEFLKDIEDKPHRYIDLSKKIITTDPNDSQTWIDLGDKIKEVSGNKRLAEIYYNNAVSCNPNNDVSWTILGWTYVIDDDIIQAESCFRRACESNNKNPSSLCGLGYVYYLNSDFDNALKYFDQSCLIEESSIALKQIGEIYLDMNDNHKGVEYLSRAYDLEQNDEYALRLGDVYYCIGDSKSSMKWLKKVRESGQQTVEYKKLLALCCYERKKYKNAIRLLSEALELDNNNYSIHVLLGKCFQLTRKFDLAQQHFNIALETHQNDSDVYLEMATAFYQSRKHKEAARYFEIAYKMSPLENKSCLCYLGYSLIMIGQYVSALYYLNQIDDRDENYVTNQCNLSFCLLILRNYKQAHEILSAVQLKTPSEEYINKYLGFYYLCIGDLPNAVYYLALGYHFCENKKLFWYGMKSDLAKINVHDKCKLSITDLKGLTENELKKLNQNKIDCL